ncbi:MAG: FAD-dependent thymidylate synthase [Clostridia bacterium]|nr:FAD-dependent thymidylate synthase [Clostridia bacterium]
MDISVVASTSLGHQATKEELDKLGGLGAGVCYLPDTMEKLFAEADEKTQRRVALTKGSGHHSPYDHGSFTLQLRDIPKIIAMILNNEKMYTTNEKSARYTKMVLSEEEQALYNKWIEIYRQEITTQCQHTCPARFTDKKIEKLAQENARYLTSVFTPTTMLYTISYRQFNNIYAMLEKEIGLLSKNNDAFSARLRSELQAFLTEYQKLPYYDPQLAGNKKNRTLSFFRREKQPILKHFGEVYSLAYKGSFAQLAQAQRHRTLSYSVELLPEAEFYVPPIIRSNPALVEEWLADCKKVEANFPQGMIININEIGSINDFILKVQERNCADAQLEIDQQTTAIKKEMYAALVAQESPLAENIEPYLKGSRCMSGEYQCSSPCGYKDGITGERII